jgi:8-oxo-dGTP diphosphatase
MHFKMPNITVDAVVLKNDAVLLVKRKNPPFKDTWALPGGFVNYGETTEAAVVRELLEETGVRMEIIGLVGVYSDPQRDPRGHTISVVYQGIYLSGEPTAGDDAVEAKFFKWEKLPVLAFDHAEILKDVQRRDS